MTTIALSFGGATHPGRVREANEDTLRVDPARGFAMVADGVGGAKGGATASRMTADIVQRELASALDGIVGDRAVDEARGRELLTRRLRAALSEASLTVHTRGLGNPSLRGMATTTVVVQVLASWALIGHVGDSKVFLVRGGVIYPLTEDHSLARDLHARGAISKEEAENYPHNVIVRAVGMQPTVEADLVAFELAADDVLVLCSDGLSDVVSADDIRQHALGGAPDAMAAALIERANAAGGPDNVTVALVRVSGPAAPARVGVEQQIGLLRHVALFRELTFQEAARVLACARERQVAAGEVIFREGDPGDRFYLVTDGAVVVSQRNTGLTTIERGGHFGELALITDAVRSATVHATRPTTLLAIDRDAFVHLVRQDHALAVKLLWSLLRHMAERVKDLSAQLSWTGR
jgi:serine/threonine protein phosphatase PrpC